MYKVLKECFGNQDGKHMRFRPNRVVKIDEASAKKLLALGLIKEHNPHPSVDQLETKPAHPVEEVKVSFFRRLFRKGE